METCPSCGAEAWVRPVPTPCRRVLAGDPATVTLCGRCLSVHPAPGVPVDRDWEPADVSDALPPDPDAAVAVGMLVTLLSSLALHRREIETIVEYLEEHPGVDPLLALDRLGTSPVLEPPTDLDRRRDQLAQILGDQP